MIRYVREPARIVSTEESSYHIPDAASKVLRCSPRVPEIFDRIVMGCRTRGMRWLRYSCVLHEMSVKRVIKASEVVRDLRDGLTDSEIMAKYKLSAKGLQSLFRKLEAAKVMKPSELYGRFPSYDDTAALDLPRLVPREPLGIALPIYDANQPEITGVVGDIAEKGLRVRYIRSAVGETKTFVIRPDELFSVAPITLEATCRWTRREGPNRDHISGYEITRISPRDLQELQELLRALTFNG